MDKNELKSVNGSTIVMYTNEDGVTNLDVRLENETVWLSVEQMAQLFNRDRSVIGKHIRNVFREGELIKEEVWAKFAHTTQHGFVADKTQTGDLDYYNLDVIISVGYRVKSKNGTHFRQWATKVLKQYLFKGYVIDKRRMDHYNDLKEVVRLMTRTIEMQKESQDVEYSGLFNVIGDYVYALDTLDKYDYQELTIDRTTKDEPFCATYENAMDIIDRLKEKFGGSALFANEKDESFKSSIGQIYQTFDGIELYPSVEEKAAMLLYLVVKNHSFSDGNKRIAAMLFLWFMDKNHILYGKNGYKRIADNTLVALTLMIAESRSEEKDVMVKLVVNLINQDNR
ncbi:MAG: virulence protein RhuM/Fic/DOC family protein [bacterium]|nr:virulence protein RhuM/Fic/DOC family protein [Candidatus Minthenecus merdequi]